MAIVFKSILITAALVLVGFGAAGEAWAEPVSPNRVILDPLVKYPANIRDHLFSDAAIAARAASAHAKESVADVKGSGKRFKFEVHCGQGRDKPVASTTYGKGPVVLEQVWVDEARRAVPVRLRRPQYPRLYPNGYVPGSSGPCSGANVGQIGDFWSGMNRSTIRSGSQESQTKASPNGAFGSKSK